MVKEGERERERERKSKTNDKMYVSPHTAREKLGG